MTMIVNPFTRCCQQVGSSDIPADEGKLWETLRLDAERVAAGEEMLRCFL
jgi:hypothetical protein